MHKTLVVLAAGMGSRYGGLKQMDSVGPSGEVVLDYSVHDALRAGFDRVVFVIREDFEQVFRDIVVARYEGQVPIKLAFQTLADLPGTYQLPEGREKPWGTGQAIWATRHVVDGPFLVVNADDFYGREAFEIMATFLSRQASGLCIGMVAYPLVNTLSEHGAVSRGICNVTPQDELARVEEHTGIARDGDRIRGIDTSGQVRELEGNEMVSMNFWGFTPEIFPHLERHFQTFLDTGGTENLKAEFYIPSAVSEIITSGAASATVLVSTGQWFGVTYREDRAAVAEALNQMVDDDQYPTPLWKHTN